jgi:CBS domain-containing protein
MSPAVAATAQAMTVTDAARIMEGAHTNAVPVVESGRLVGTLTDRDIVRVIARDGDPHIVCVGDVASRDAVSVRASDALEHGLQLMAMHQMRQIPVVDDDYRVVGTLSQADAARPRAAMRPASARRSSSAQPGRRPRPRDEQHGRGRSPGA